MKQKGQALIELLLFSLVMLVLLAAGVLLQRWQQVKIQLQHRASFNAFTAAQIDESHSEQILSKPKYIADDTNALAYKTWSSRYDLNLVPTNTIIDISRKEALLDSLQSRRFVAQAKADGWVNSAWSMAMPWAQSMRLQEQTSLWTGTAATLSVSHTRERLENSKVLWRHTKTKTDRFIEPLISELTLIDQAWSRPKPQLDWLKAWQNAIPN